MIILDANILIRAVLGTKVPALLRKYGRQDVFFAPDAAFREAYAELPVILKRRGVAVAHGLGLLEQAGAFVRTVALETYAPMEALAHQRLARRDVNDWPILATALALQHPIWTEDMDFFGCGVATWTTDRVDLYLADAVPIPC